MNRNQVMELLRDKGKGPELDTLGPYIQALLGSMPLLPDPVTVQDIRTNKKEHENRLGALALVSASIIIEATYCIECDDPHAEVTEQIYQEVGAAVGSVLNLVILATRAPLVRDLTEALGGVLKRHAAARRRPGTASADGGGGTDAPPVPEAAGRPPETVGEDLPPGVVSADTPEEVFEKGRQAGGGAPLAGTDAVQGSVN